MDNFELQLFRADINDRSIQSNLGRFCNFPVNSCFLGVPDNELYGRVPLEHLPTNLPSIFFLADFDQTDLVEAFVHSEHAKKVSSITIGCSSYSKGLPTSYAKAISALQDADCPHLKELSLGEWVLFHNAHSICGHIGDITPVLRNLSHIEELSLWGNFELTEPLCFNNLKKISVENSGPITNKALSNLMRSAFPQLTELFFDLDCENFFLDPTGLDMDCADYETRYTFPDCFLLGSKLPKLSLVEITGGFAGGEKDRLVGSNLAQRVGKMFLEDMEEP